MRKFRLFYILAAVIIASVSSSKTIAQEFVLPSPLSQNSTISELLSWLDETSFAKARIQIIYAEKFSPKTHDVRLSRSAFFATGFKRAQTAKQCEMVLRSEQSKILAGYVDDPLPNINDPNYFYADTKFLNKIYREDSQTLEKIIADGITHPTAIGINLKRVKAKRELEPSFSKGGIEDTEKNGVWRTHFREKSSNAAINSYIYLTKKSETGNTYNSSLTMSGDEVEFLFDDEKSAVEFDQVFRRAIQLCGAEK